MKAKHIIGMVVMLAAGIYGATAFEGTLTPYVNFAQAQEAQTRCQVMGEINHENTRYDLSTHVTLFTIEDEEGTELLVSYSKIMPGNFEQAESVVAKGRYDGQRFIADDLLVKCPSKYQGTDVEYQAEPEAENVSR